MNFSKYNIESPDLAGLMPVTVWLSLETMLIAETLQKYKQAG
jgi:hypothetical protein